MGIALVLIALIAARVALVANDRSARARARARQRHPAPDAGGHVRIIP